MEYLIFGSIAIILVLFIINYFNKQRAKKNIQQIRAAWGKPKNETFDFDNIRRYADATTEETFHRLTDQTLEDIDFYGLFTFIDRTTSKVGQQFLFKKITEPTNHTENQSERLTGLFAENKQLREEIQLDLLRLNTTGAYFIPTLLKEKLLEKPKWFNLLILDLLVVASLIILSFKYPVFIVILIIPITLNVFLHYWNKGNAFQFLRSFPQLSNLIAVSNSMIKRGELFYDKSTEESIVALKPFQRLVSVINLENGKGIQSELSVLGTYIIELLKAFFLVEVFALYKITQELENKKSSIQTLFNFIGNIDSSISIASLRDGQEKTCRPTLVAAKKELITKGMYHPLIENCVASDLSLNGKSLLLTGSNMSGKSTFLRTLTINSILAQTIYTCFATEFTSPILKQFSSIRIDDNLFDGKSYYFQEVNIMASLLSEVNSPHQNLFVLDEVFKGTNTLERIAAAKAILSYLNKNNNIVVVSTHDIELAHMLSHEYDLYHFTETVENNELHFDHQIKAGQLKTRNAIKILELSNYPAEVTNEARQISSTLEAVQKLPKA